MTDATADDLRGTLPTSAGLLLDQFLESKMSQTNWKDTAELIGISAIVASLIFVGLQMKQDRDFAIAEASIATLANLIEIRNQQHENINVWISGNSGLELDAEQRMIYRNLIQNAHLSAFFMWASFKRAGLGNVDFAASDFAGFLYQNPAARDEWESYVGEIDSFRVLPGEDIGRNNDVWENLVRSRLAKIAQAYD